MSFFKLGRLVHRLNIALALLIAGGCAGPSDHAPAITLATTTSTRDSGLLDVLVPMFEQETGVSVRVIAVGSGQALQLGRSGDADVLLTHAPEAERRFVEDGYGEARLPIMHNDFVLVGPETDPAGVRRETSITQAFRRIAGSEAPFVSRGDDSGTHIKEREIWAAAGAEPREDRYIQAGAGMAEALRMSAHKRAYTLSDRSTFLAQQDSLELTILSEGDSRLQNPYAAIVVNSRRHPHVRADAARRFIAFLRSSPAREAIRTFGVDRFGQPLFFVEEETSVR